MMRAVLLAILLAGAAAGAAKASIITYEASGTLSDGRELAGSFTMDDSKSAGQGYGNWNLTVGTLTYRSLFSIVATFQNQPIPILSLVFLGTGGAQNLELSVRSTRAGQFYLDADGGPLLPTSSMLYAGSLPDVHFIDGALTPVPEPATLALLALPLGLTALGLAALHRRGA